MSKEPPKSAYTSEGRAHAREANVLASLLAEELSDPEFQKVYPTADREGRVSLTFRQVWEIMGYPGGLEQFEAEEQEEQGGT